jgi:hypothetical protein
MKLLRKQYGEGDASVAYADLLGKYFISLGFERCLAQPCFFRHPERRANIEVHQDDLRCSGKTQMLDWFQRVRSGVIELKWSRNLGPGDTCGHLKCYRRRTSDGARILGHTKHIDAILVELRLQICPSARCQRSQSSGHAHPCATCREAHHI